MGYFYFPKIHTTDHGRFQVIRKSEGAGESIALDFVETIDTAERLASNLNLDA